MIIFYYVFLDVYTNLPLVPIWYECFQPRHMAPFSGTNLVLYYVPHILAAHHNKVAGNFKHICCMC
jgi:hypothetical protein